MNLVALNNRLYAHTGDALVQSIDGGGSWKTVRIDVVSSHSRLTVAGNTLYVISPEIGISDIFRLATDGDGFVPVQDVPMFEMDFPSIKESTHSEGKGHGGDDNLIGILRHREHATVGAFAVSGGTFYAEYKRQLFKWQPGEAAWKETGLVDTSPQLNETSDSGFKLAVSGDTVYVGTRDGKLFQSLDGGDSWKDITSTLPRPFTAFTEIVFAGSTVYVATDAGVLASQTGSHWRVITDEVVIDRFVVDGITLYGAGDTGGLPLGCPWRLEAGIAGGSG